MSLLILSHELHSSVFYYPIGRWPYIERNVENIKSLCNEVWDVDGRELLVLRTIVDEGVVKDTFNIHAVRMLIEFSDKDVYIDDNGVASTDLLNGVIISVERIRHFHEILSQNKIERCNID
ncbi:TPA: hypothetical protein N2G37_003564 [Salmonella enterica]|nr:hypothetical protein [Salmonella enterica subsp. salamae]HCL5275920.1 hypothetical protein [Salmonella enterica]